MRLVSGETTSMNQFHVAYQIPFKKFHAQSIFNQQTAEAIHAKKLPIITANNQY